MRHFLERFRGSGGWRRWITDCSGSVTVFFVVMFPILMLIGGLATDAVRLNAQKRYTQSQADLAAQSAARYLPDAAKVRLVARRVVAENTLYGRITLVNSDIILGSYSFETGFVPHANQSNPLGATAVRVRVPSPYRPLLLGPVMRDEDVVITRSAVAGQKAVVVFTLRNRLLGVNTRESILDPVLSGLGIGLNVAVLSYEGLTNTRVKVQDLLSLLSLGLATEVLTFNDVLHLPLTGPRLFSALIGAGGLPAGALPAGAHGGQPVTLAEVMRVSPALLDARIGDVLPDVTINAFDLMMAFAGLAAKPTQRLDIGTGLNLSPLANVALRIGLVRPPVIGIGRIGDDPPPRATVSQVDTLVSADVLGQGNAALLRLSMNVAIGTADATAISLNCGASQPADQLALFRAETAPVELALTVGIIDSRAGVAPRDMERVSLARGVKEVPIRFDQFRKPVPVRNPLRLSNLVADTGTFLDTVRADLQAQVSARACEAGFLALLLCPLFTVVSSAVAALLTALSAIANSIAWVLASVGVDAILQAVLDLLGIGVAQADLILDDYSCNTSMLQ